MENNQMELNLLKESLDEDYLTRAKAAVGGNREFEYLSEALIMYL